jgi:hypothetical protein
MGWLDLYSQLDHGVKIYPAPECRNMVGRVQASAGTRPVTSKEIVELHYESEARLPQEPWRLLTRAEQAALMAERLPRDVERTVSIVKLPGAFSAGVWRSFEPVEGAEVPDDIVATLESTCTLDEPLDWIGYTSNLPGLKTVTVGNDGKHYIGLHLDSWDDLELERRPESTNRICVNIGASDRYFLFLPFSLNEMGYILSELHKNLSIHHTSFGDHFMERFPDVPAIRCRLAPGEAYIASTENLMHDGSSEGQQQLDELFTVRGHIRPLPAG